VTYKKKLIEVALPLEAINRESAREKSIRHGHPSTLHLWWARRPLAACRAVLFASLVDDPSAHPDRFPTEEAQQQERERLFRIIEDLVKWENSTNTEVLKAAGAEIMASCDGNPPPVLDPFCGGGSIPLEAQRLGLEAHASDLNPVAVLITKALIEIPPKFAGRPPVHPDDGSSKELGSWEGARGLAEDVRYYGRWMRDEAERRIGHLYPKVKLPPEHGGGEATVIAWIWARTVKSPNPAWDGPMPLVRSFALSTKKGKETWVQPIVDREHRRIRFEIRAGPGCPEGTVGRNGAVCLATGTPVPLSYIRAEGKAGRMGAQLMAIVAEGSRGRIYLPPNEGHERVPDSAVPPDDVPDTDLPTQALSFRVQSYGMTKHRHLFTARQLSTLNSINSLVVDISERIKRDGADARLPDDGIRLSDGGTGATAYAEAIVVYLGLLASREADFLSTLSTWSSNKQNELVRGTFSRQALAMTWDFAEANPFASSTGSLLGLTDMVVRVVSRLPTLPQAWVSQRDARNSSGLRAMCSTDPPYYDNVGYADLSDFFYVWLRSSLRNVYPMETSTLLVPKVQELVASPYRFHGSKHDAEQHFEQGLGEAFSHMCEAQISGYPLTAFYAFKQTEEDEDIGEQLASTGWQTMLEGLLRAGLTVTGTWPMRSERGGRTNDLGANALASSIVLVCRPRLHDASLATSKEFLADLRSELPLALRRLQQGNIAPVDLAQAAIGPGMGIFSRYSRVIEANGRPMTVRTALGRINQVLDETLAQQEADFDAETRWALAWFDQYGMNPGPFGVAETLSKAKNTAVNGLVAAGILASRAGKVRLLERDELPQSWDPATDRRLTVWEVTQHLIRALYVAGEAKAAEILHRVGTGLGETARELAYRLYTICERKKWAKEALAYNALVVSWPEIVRLAGEGSPQDSGQQTLV
jgi:putative DNA methylase